ncbi:xanthine dehydrogenase family protein molybdopterin-binding subunit [Streptomyces sp. P38-E01]|uniref:Xanthine dehydrogenase family protein molybdopterin-binding subunit n=1 Tax=Streptomyces tardus TaxID=2780544 RepID=A0A949JDJ8_9ACTN|nr:xanthine dehydrogenase family protein molybdopterin-binding subunit [Streptomyces tardus]MBU7597941.1 xanthine dehydrogenase family protein molybdopterin-binding subunit [Streptomyces tardus]
MTTTPTGTESATARRAVGTAHPRVEGYEKVTGTARYAGEIPFVDLAHGALVLSTVAHGRIVSVDEAGALRMPGVLAVLHHGNAPRIETEYVGFLGAPDPTTAVFQHDRVPTRGWPVALVVAETPEQAAEAAASLEVTYREEPHDTAFRPDHPDAYYPGSTIVGPPVSERGDQSAALAASAFVVDELYETAEMHHSAMEPHAATARWNGGRLEIVDSNQGTVWVASELAKLFSLDLSAIRVRSEHVGGGFGSKGCRAHQVAAVMATTQLRRPVRVVMTRRQTFSLAGHRAPTAQRVRLGADAGGRLLALDHESLNQTATGYEWVEPAALPARTMYNAQAHRTAHRLVRLNVPSPTAMRAPGEAPGSFALESAMDELAERCGIDPVELRVRNDTQVAPGSGKPFTARRLVGCLREGARRFGWEQRTPRSGSTREGRWLIGTGVACASFSARAMPTTAAITAHPDGTYTVHVNAADIGTGARTALTLVAADELGTDTAHVRVRLGDSDLGPAGIAGGSTGTRSWAWAVNLAARELRERLALGADIPPQGITVRSDTTEAVKALGHHERHSFGAQFAEVAVDPDTGEVRVRRMLGVFAAGQIVNPLTARNQLVGGMTWGISMALHEEAVRDARTGGHYSPDLAGYHVAANADVPRVEAYWIDDPDPEDPVGIKGIGEIGTVGAAAAVTNAVWHATGVRQRSLPVRPDRVLAGGAGPTGA